MPGGQPKETLIKLRYGAGGAYRETERKKKDVITILFHIMHQLDSLGPLANEGAHIALFRSRNNSRDLCVHRKSSKKLL